MSHPRVLVVGAGSAGSRHARLLVAHGADVHLADPDPARLAAVEGVTPVPGDRVAMAGYDGIVVASPTILHLEQAFDALDGGGRVLVEKPLSATGARIDELVAVAGDRLAVAFNLRFHEPVVQLVGLVHTGRVGRVLSARVWYGQHLATWRPNVDYRTSYSAQARLGGGILLDASHELDVLLWLLGGRFEVVGAVVERSGTLEADVEDLVDAVLRHESGALANVALDMVSRRYRRGIEVVGELATARLDWARGVLEIEDEDGCHAETVATTVADSYDRQAAHFLGWVGGGTPMPVDAETGARSVQLADAIRTASG